MHVGMPRGGVSLAAEKEESCRIDFQYRQRQSDPSHGLPACPGIRSLFAGAIQTARPASSHIGISTGGRFWTAC